MPDVVRAVADSPWVLVLVLVVAGLDAVLPFMPSESTVVAVGVVAAGTGHPHLVALIAAAAAGAYAGDVAVYVIARRGNRTITARMNRRARARAVHERAHRLLHRHGGLVLIFARYLPGGRSAAAVVAGVVGYPAVRFRWYTGAGVLLWATQAALLGRLGGAVFSSRPLLGLAAGWAGALVVSGLALAAQQLAGRRPAGAPGLVPAEEPPRVWTG